MATKATGFFDTQITLPERASNPLLTVEDGVGIISLQGPMMRNPDLMSRLLFYAVDTEQTIRESEILQQCPSVPKFSRGSGRLHGFCVNQTKGEDRSNLHTQRSSFPQGTYSR